MPQHHHVTLTYSTIFRVVLVLFGITVLYLIREVVALLFVSIVLAAAFDPWVDWLSKYKIPRSISILSVYVIIFAVVALVIVLLIPPVVEQIGQIADNFPYYYHKILTAFANLQGFATSNLDSELPSNLETIGSTLAQATKSIFSTISSIFGGIVSFIAVLVIVFYITVEEATLKRFVISLTPQPYQEHAKRLIVMIQSKIGLWLRGQLTLCLIIGILTFLGLWMLGIKYALLLAIIAGLLEIVPFVGPTIAAVPSVFVALSDSWTKVIMVLVLYFLIQQAENHFITPKVMEKAVGLNPIIVIVAVLIGVKLAGIMGALLAVPVAAAIGVVMSDYFSQKGKGIKANPDN